MDEGDVEDGEGDDPMRTDGSGRRAVQAALAGAALVAGLVVPAAPAAAAITLTTSATAVAEAPDFAGEAYADPWDFADAGDLPLDPTVAGSGLSAITQRDGRYELTAARGGYVWLSRTIEGALPAGRDTALQPVDASRFTHLSVRMWSSAAGQAQLWWFSCGTQLAACSGAMQFTVRPGWGTYELPVTNNTGTPVAWTGLLRGGLRLVPNATSAASVQIDHVRLHRPQAASQLRVTSSGGGSGTALYLLPGTTSGDGAATSLGALGVSRTVDLSGLAAGTWYLQARDASGQQSARVPVLVDAAPRPVVVDPDLAGGEDWASTVRRDAWDFSQASDVARLSNVRDASVSGGVLRGTNAGPNQNDPQVDLPLAGPINGSTYHRLTLRVGYDGPFGLEDAPGGGMLSRLVWQTAGAPGAYQDLEDLVVRPGDQTITVDLATSPPSAVVDPTVPRRIGWTGQQITSLRFDPNEDPGARSWRVDDVRIARDDRGLGAFDIRLRDDAWEPGTVADVHVDTDRQGFDGRLIASGVPVAQTGTTVRWELGSTPPGTYWVHVTMRDARSSSRAYSSGPVQMERRPVSGSLDTVRQVGAAVQVRGWVIDPDRGREASPVHVYVDGRFAASAAADAPRPDVERAVPGYGPDHGVDLALPGLAAGRHQVCVYALRTGAPSHTVGCRAVVVAHDPVGTVDAVVRAPGGLDVRGWALDRSTTAPTAVHVYVDGRPSRTTTASSARPDVAAAYPGYGSAHGYAVRVPAAAGTRQVCAYGIDTVAPGTNALLGCRTVQVSGTSVGSLDAVTRASGRASVRGWALDPDTAGAGTVHVYVEGRFAGALTASGARPDVAAAYPAWGPAHGFTGSVALPAGPATVCAYALDAAGAGGSVTLGCRRV